MNNVSDCGIEGVPETVMPMNLVIAGVKVFKWQTAKVTKKSMIFLSREAVKLLRNINK